MLAKLIVYGSTRDEAIRRMASALGRFDVAGLETTIPFLRFVVDGADFQGGHVSTQLIDERLLDEFIALRSSTD
jgi:acetyl/propionyl-CoA carboxylase alpha subunit